MAFEGLSEKLNSVFKGLRGKGRLTEEDIKLAMREVRMALLEADVSYKVVKDFVAKVSERAVGTEVLDSLTPAQQVIKIVNEELTALMGGANARLTFANNPPTVVMMVGLQGAGKTTNVAKLAGLLRRQGKRPLPATCTVPRPSRSCRSSAPSSACPCSRWGRSTPSPSRSKRSSTPGITATTSSFSIPPAACTSTSSSWTSSSASRRR